MKKFLLLKIEDYYTYVELGTSQNIFFVNSHFLKKHAFINNSTKNLQIPIIT